MVPIADQTNLEQEKNQLYGNEKDQIEQDSVTFYWR